MTATTFLIFHFAGIIISCLILSLFYKYRITFKDRYDNPEQTEESFILSLMLMALWEITFTSYLFYRLFKWIAGIK